MIPRPNRRRQYCPAGHDTFVVGRSKRGTCKKCKSIANTVYRIRCPEETRLSKQKYRDNNRETLREKGREYQKANKPQACVNQNRRRARLLDEFGTWVIPESDFISLLWETDPNCYYCRIPLKGAYHLEHKIPLSRPEECPEGKKLHEPWNLRLACPPCNWSKNDKTALEYVERQRATR